MKIWKILFIQFFMDKLNFHLLLDSLCMLLENFKFIFIFSLLSEFFKEISDLNFDLNNFSSIQITRASLIIHISQLIFFVEGITKKYIQNINFSLKEAAHCLDNLLVVSRKLDILFIYQPYSLDNLKSLDEIDFWKNCEKIYKNSFIFKEGGLLFSITSTFFEILTKSFEKNEKNIIINTLKILEEIAFLHEEQQQNHQKFIEFLKNSKKNYDEFFKEIPITTGSIIENLIEPKKFILVHYFSFILNIILKLKRFYSLFISKLNKIFLLYQKIQSEEIEEFLKINSCLFFEIMKIIQKILKNHGHEILAEINKILYNNKEKSGKTRIRTYSHYNEIGYSYYKKLNEANINDREINYDIDYHKIHENSFENLKNLYDLFCNHSLKDNEKLQILFENFVVNSFLFKINEMIESTMLFNQNMVFFSLTFSNTLKRVMFCIYIFLKNQGNF